MARDEKGASEISRRFLSRKLPYCNVLSSMEIVFLSLLCLHGPFKHSTALTDSLFYRIPLFDFIYHMSSPSLMNEREELGISTTVYRVKKTRIMVLFVYAGFFYSSTMFSCGTFQSTQMRLAAGHICEASHDLANVNGADCWGSVGNRHFVGLGGFLDKASF